MITLTPIAPRPPLRFDRNELAGAFGDMGTDVPLLVGVALAAKLDGASLLLMFGLMQILTGLAYRLPMPVQPLNLLSFQSYGGGSAALPHAFRAGLALIRVHLSPSGGGPGLDATMRVTCRLPGSVVPEGFEEGVRLAVDDVINFNREVSGATLFILTP